MSRLRVLALGADVAAEAYPRARALVAAARSAGSEVVELTVPVPAAGPEKQGLARQPWRWPAFALAMLRARSEARKRIASAVASVRPDVVLVLYPGHLLVRWARAAWRGPIALDLFLSAHDTVVLDRGLWGRGSPVAACLLRLDRRACACADLVLLDTAPHRDRVAELVGLPRERFAVVPIGDPLQPELAAAYRAPAAGERLEVLFFGTGVPLHGLAVLLEAVERTPGVRLTLVGGSESDRARARRLPEGRCVVDEGFVGRPRLEELLRRTHLVAGIFDGGLKASLVVPLKVMHGLAFGRPVVTADTPAIRSLLSPGDDCLVVPPGDASALADKLAEVAREPAPLQALAAGARRRFEATFSIAATGAVLGAHLEALGGGAPRRAGAARRGVPPVRLPHPLRDRGLWLVVLAAVVAYGTATLGTFVYDDVHSVRDNEAISDLSRLPELLWNPAAFSSLDNRMYRPVLLVSFALDHLLGGGAAWMFKLTNVLLHAGCAVLLRAVAKALGARPAAATAAGLAFAVHPLASEAVNMVSARSELLQLLGMLAAVACWARGGRKAPWLAAAFTVLACGAKEPAVLTPLVLVAIDLLASREKRPALRATLAKVAPALVAVVLWLVLRRLVLGVATTRMPALHGVADAFSGGSRGLSIQLATMATILPRCLLLALCPYELSIDPEVSLRGGFSDPQSLCGALGILGLVAWALWRGTKPVRIGTCLAAACSLPWVVVPLNAMLCEHRLYGLLAGCALAASSLAVRWPERRSLRVAGVAALALLALRSSLRSLDYRDEVTLWQQVRARQPDAPRALFALGVASLVAGDPWSARPLFERAIDVYPHHWRARRQLAMTELQMPRDEARPFTALHQALLVREQSPRDPFVRLLCANCLMAAGDWSGDKSYFAEAEREALSCLEIAEPKGLVYINAAHARELAGDADGAVALLDASIARGLDHGSVYLAKSQILLRTGRRQEALAILRMLLARDPFDRAAHEALESAQAAAPPVGPPK